MNLITFLLLVLTFPLWFPIVVLPVSIGLLWIIVYPIIYTVHQLAMKAQGKSVRWHLGTTNGR